MSKITVISKENGKLGEADLDIASFKIDATPSVKRLNLTGCADAEAYVELSISGEEKSAMAERRSSTASKANKGGEDANSEEMTA